MVKTGTRNIGAEILEGIHETTRGETGRVVMFPPVAEASLGEAKACSPGRQPGVTEAKEPSKP